MTSGNIFSTFAPGKQALIVQDFMDLFKSNQRGYGQGEFQGARFDEDKSKWIPGGVRWTWGPTTPDQWLDHLSGVRLLGQGVLCDDNRCWYACLDVDIYDIDYMSEMSKIKRSELPLVVFRTKSGGLRITVFFSEGIEAELVIPRMKRVASLLGYAGCEIFPKQTKLDVTNGDCPSWIYVPYGGTHDMFPEQGCMNERGNLMDIAECVALAKELRLPRKGFLELFAAEDAAKANGKANGRKHVKGAWIQEESYEITINTMFCDGPPCLWTIAHAKCREMQNNFLFNVAMFLRRKYPENWDKALEYVNYNVLQPVGDRDKLNSLIKRHPEKEYLCGQEPICSHCNPHACRRMPHGVGSGSGVDHFELGLTAIKREPRIYIANVGDTRMTMSGPELRNLNKYKDQCTNYGVPMPLVNKQVEWEQFISKQMETATEVEPTLAMRTNAFEYEMLTAFFSINVPTFMRVGSKGGDDVLRVNTDERKIYFKWKHLMRFITRSFNSADVAPMRKFVDDRKNCDYRGQELGSGARDWWRYTYSISFDKLDTEDIEKWLSSDSDAINA
jgi:hypothetical protein